MLGASTFYLWNNKINLADTNSKKVQEFYTKLSDSQVAFTDAGEMVLPDEQKFLTQKDTYIKEGTDFIEANLRTMKLKLYSAEKKINTLDIQSKGKKDSWWQTPTGDYNILSKEINHFSSIGHVWMPYSMKFYGNYFIHGWPYYDDGTPVSKTYSGGCIRMKDEDAKIVFDFAKNGMPLLVLEDQENETFGNLIKSNTNSPLPNITAESFLISNLATGENIIEKNSEKQLPIASLTKLMTAVVAHEIVYLGKQVKDIYPTSTSTGFSPQMGKYYSGFDLLFPLLMQSSNDSAKILASFIGEKTFITNMNEKANSLSMNDSNFADSSGIDNENLSSAKDIKKLLNYIFYKRHFIFDITKGIVPKNSGLVEVGDTIGILSLENFNEFSDNLELIGMKNGETTVAKQTMASVWNIKTPSGNVPISIIVLGSENRKLDTENLLNWIKNNYIVSI
jgi:hypothetical protein